MNGMQNESEVIEQFRAAMRGRDIIVDEPIIADGKLHRYHAFGDRRHSRNAWAILHFDAHPAGKFGCHKRYGNEKFTWKSNGGRELTADERRNLREIAQTRTAKREAETLMLQERATIRAEDLYLRARLADIHPYLTAKGVPSNPRLRVGNWYRIDEETGEEILVAGDALLAPLMDFALRIHSIQAILSDGEGGFRKQYLKGGAKRGYFLSLAKPTSDVVLICEGLATGLSLWQCTGHAVLVAFDSGNLIYVAKELQRVRPNSRIVLCADNDQWTDKPVKNPGVHFANQAAMAVGGSVAVPEFIDLSTRPSDFNDLHQLQGGDAVRLMLPNTFGF